MTDRSIASPQGRLSALLCYGFWSLQLLLGLAMLAGSLYLWLVDYEQLTEDLLSLAQKQHWKAYFQTAVLPPPRLQLLRYLLLGLLLGQLVFSIWSYGRCAAWASWTSKAIKALWASFIASFRQLSTAEYIALWGLFILYLARSLFHIYYYAIEYDEAWTYNHFVSKGMFVAAISPNNNHIFYSLLAVATDYLPLPTQYSLRLPALLSGLCSFFLCFAVLRKMFSSKLALVGLAFFAFSSAMNFFSFLARGYGWMLCFSIVLTAAFYQLVEQRRAQKRYYVLFSIATILGVYSNPGFLYLWVPTSLCLLLLLIGRDAWRQRILAFVNTQLLTALVLLLLHLPLLISNGFAFLAKAATTSQASGSFWHYLNSLADWWFLGNDTPLFWSWAVLWGICFVFVAWRGWKRQRWLILVLVQLALPFLWWWIMRVHTPYRLWSYELWFWTIALVFLLQLISGLPFWKSSYFFILAGILALFNGIVSEQHYFVNWSAELDREAEKMAALLLDRRPVLEECYTFSRYDKPLLEFHFLRQGKRLNCWMPFEASKDYRAFGARPYEAVLLDTDDYSPTQKDWDNLKKYPYQLIYSNHRIQLYVLKK